MSYVDNILEWLLFPMDPEEFKKEYLDKKPLVLRREDQSYYEALYTLNDTLEVIYRSRTLTNYDIRLSHAEKKIDKKQFALVDKYNNVDVAKSIDFHSLKYLFRQEKATVVIENLGKTNIEVNKVVRGLNHELGSVWDATLFFTPIASQGFPAHFDLLDFFVLQLHGSKRWRLYESPIKHASRREFYTMPLDYENQKVIDEFHLRQGDLLYLPRGILHGVNTTDELSVHISLNGQPTSWVNAITDQIRSKSSMNQEISTGFRMNNINQETVNMLRSFVKDHLVVNGFEKQDKDIQANSGKLVDLMGLF